VFSGGWRCGFIVRRRRRAHEGRNLDEAAGLLVRGNH
jgi:hypothetical protein